MEQENDSKVNKKMTVLSYSTKIGTVELLSPVPILQYAILFYYMMLTTYFLSTMKQQYPTDTDYFPQSLLCQLQCLSQERCQLNCPLGTHHSMQQP